MPPCSTSALTPETHVQQLQRVFGPLSPGFVAEELDCALEKAEHLLYGRAAAKHCWVRLLDVAQVARTDHRAVKRWMRARHIPCAQPGNAGPGATLLVHLADARWYFRIVEERAPGRDHPNADQLPRWPLESRAVQAPRAPTEVDWQLARRADWPMTVERLADAVLGARSPAALRRTRTLLKGWERQGRVVCFARGLYDLVRPQVVLSPDGYQGDPLPDASALALRAHHPELAHWPAAALAGAWRAYSAVYGGRLLAVADRREPTLLEYLLIRQLHTDIQDLKVDARYDVLARDVALYRLTAAPQPDPVPQVTFENIQAGLIDFDALVQATRKKMQSERRGRSRPLAGQPE